MDLHWIDISIVLFYLILMVVAGSFMSGRASKNLNSYFLGGNKIPWWALSFSNAGGMFDISGTMWLVYLAFVYGMKSVYIPWLWPVFNQIFMMIYLAVWLRRSKAMTGAEWITTRFDQECTGGRMAHITVVIFSVISMIGFLSYGFIGIGKFAAIFLPWDWSPHIYALIITVLTAIYVVQGGMFGVVVTDIMQYIIMTAASVIIGIIAMTQVSPELISKFTPDGWADIWFGWRLGLDWSGVMESVNAKIMEDGTSIFTAFIMMAIFKGIWVSLAGPVATQGLQRILAAKNAKEAAVMNGFSVIVVSLPRYFMIGGVTILALAFFSPQLNAMGADIDFELILPFAIKNFVPVGLMGVLLAGLLSAHMSTTSSYMNVAPAYIVNDVFKKYIKPNGTNKDYVRISYIVTALIAVASILFGLIIESVDSATKWIVNALWAGSAAANVLKWHWWRFNGYGYFWGMLSGLIIALLIPAFFPDMNSLFAYPYILVVSLAGSFAGSLLTQPEKDSILIKFYSSVHPWGWWKPIREKVMAENPAFKVNQGMGRDAINVVIGAVWQLTIMGLPLALVIRNWNTLIVLSVILVITTLLLKTNWYNKLEEE